MQVPEKLSLIGGSILLASMLIFTLESQASHILPKVAQPISNIQDKTSDVQNGNNFSDDFQDAQKKGLKTGQWGTTKFYVNDHNDLYVGNGNPKGQLKSAVGADLALKIKSITFDGHIQAPNNSWGLLSDFPSATKMIGLNKIDVSQAGDLSWAFSDDATLSNLNISSWRTPHLQHGRFMFGGIDAMKELDISNLDTSHAEMYDTFDGNKPNLNHIKLGTNTYLRSPINGKGSWSNGHQTISDTELGTSNTSHAGTWCRQS